MKTLVFDTETNGLITSSLLPLTRQPRVIELFGVTLDQDCNEVEAMGWLFNIDEKLDPKIVEITGISDDMLKNQPKFSDCADEIESYIMSHDEIVAHNVTFDCDVLSMEFARLNPPRAIKWPRRLCTVEATEYMMGYRLKLIDLHTKLFGEAFAHAHRAENDVRATARCFTKLRQDGAI